MYWPQMQSLHLPLFPYTIRELSVGAQFLAYSNELSKTYATGFRALKDISLGQVLMRLFQTARRFDMHVQPQLVLLQKTLLNIEGLGRQLDPELDLWTTAKPFLERWMREQLGPRAFLRSLQREFPRWWRMLPETPAAAFDFLRKAGDPATDMPIGATEDNLRAAVAGGADAIQMREKGLADRELLHQPSTLWARRRHRGVRLSRQEKSAIAGGAQTAHQGIGKVGGEQCVMDFFAK